MPKVCAVCGEEYGEAGNHHEACQENELLLSRLWHDQPVVKALLRFMRAFDPLNV